MKKKHLLLFIMIVFAFFIYQINSSSVFFTSPDESIQKFFTELYGDTGEIYYSSNDSNCDFFSRIRGAYPTEGKIVPLKFIGFPLLLGPINNFNSIIVPYIIALLSSLSIFLIYLLSKEIYSSKKIGIFAGGILLFLPFFWYWASHPFFENILSSFFFLFGYLYFLRIFKDQLMKNYILSSIFFSLACLIRYDIAIVVFCFVMPFVIIKAKSLDIRKSLIAITIFFLTILPAFIMSKVIYGGFFIYGQKILSAESTLIVIKSFKNIFLNLEGIYIFFPFVLFGFASLFYYRKNKGINNIFNLSMLLYLILFCYIYISEFAPKHTNILHESFTRYFLIFYIFLTMSISNFILKVKNKKIIFISLLVIIVISIIITIPILSWHWKSMSNSGKIVDFLIEKTPNNSFILVSGEDKFAYSFRKVSPINNYKVDNAIDVDRIKYALNLCLEDKSVFIYGKYLDSNIVTKISEDFDLTLIDDTELFYEVRSK